MKRSYCVSVVSKNEGEQVPHHGYIQLSGDESNHDRIIKEATLNTFPDAVEYFPWQIPNRQFRRQERDAFLRQITDLALSSTMAIARLENRV